MVYEIADALLIHETTVRRYLKDLQQLDKLTPENGGSKSKLTIEQTQELIAHLTEVTYFQTDQICRYIKDTYEVTSSVAGWNQWLHKHGFSYKQPQGVPHKFSEQKPAEFIQEYEIITGALQDDDVLLFMDATPPTQATKISSGWIPTAVDKPIETTGSRRRLNFISGLRLNIYLIPLLLVMTPLMHILSLIFWNRSKSLIRISALFTWYSIVQVTTVLMT